MTRGPRSALLALTGVVLVAAQAQAQTADCGTNLGANARRVQASGVTLAWVGRPPSIPLDRHFELEIVLCGSVPGSPPGTAASVKVDALMPAHRHGMNYRSTTAPAGPGRYLAQGLLFHMPGQWRLVFDVDQGGQRLRLTDDITVR